MRKKILYLLLFSLCILFCFGCQDNVEDNNGSSSNEANQPIEGDDSANIDVPDFLENDNIRLEFANGFSEIHLIDKNTGTVWSSSMSDSGFDLSSVNVNWQQRMQSLFSISTTHLGEGTGVITSYNLAGTSYNAVPYETEDGIGIRYDITGAGIVICIEFALTDSGVSIRIPNERIEESGGFGLVSLDLMPFFGGAVDGRDGYLFYPDGSGAIMRFDDSDHWGESYVTYSVYGDIVNNSRLKQYFDESEPLVMLPVFGANYGADGFVSYVTEGEENSKITVTPSNSIIPVNYIYPSFTYRRGFDDLRITSSQILQYDDIMLDTNYEIRYEILPQEHAEYADMATAYREYLIENEQLLKKDDSDSLHLALDLFMGIKEDGLIFDTFQSLTSFQQAQEILDELKEAIDGEIDATLLGWTKNGYGTEPQYFPVNRNLGGSSGMEELVEYAEKNEINLSLAADFITVAADASGYNKRNDVSYLGNYQLITDVFSSIRLISPNVVAENFEDFLSDAEKYSLGGLSFENIGVMLYYNYGDRNTVSTSECKEYWQQILQDAKDTFGSVTCEGGNLYALAVSDKVTEIPKNHYGYRMTTDEVPFYQILVHGYVDYTGEAMNLSSDADVLRLKWIEYGYTPYFEITYESSEKLIKTEYNQLFTSQYDDWKDEILNTYQIMQDALQDVQNVAIISHEEVQQDVFCTGYENGVKIYVNYNESAVDIDGIMIGALDYKVTGGSK